MRINNLYIHFSEKFGQFVIAGFGTDAQANRAIARRKYFTGETERNAALEMAKIMYPGYNF